MGNFYPRSPCGERHLRVLDYSKSSIISIHALLAESDLEQSASYNAALISIHALLAESDYLRLYFKHPNVEFLSTLSLRRATSIIDIINNVIDNFYPRSPCGERQRTEIHASSQQEFLSTLSLRRATRLLKACLKS